MINYLGSVKNVLQKFNPFMTHQNHSTHPLTTLYRNGYSTHLFKDILFFQKGYK